MIRKLTLRVLSFVAILAIVVVALPQTTQAFTFNPNNLIDDVIFENVNSMSAAQVDAFLNTFGSSCISSNKGFRTPDPQGWSDVAPAGYRYGGNVTAGTAIKHVSTLYHVNPQVILSTLQKEQSLVSGSAGCYPNTPNPASATSMTNKCGSGTRSCTLACTHAGGCVNIAMGYGCPNYCEAKNEGFSKQITLGTWLLRFGEQRAYGNLTGYVGYETGDQDFTYTGPMTAGSRKRCASCSLAPFDGKYTTVNGVNVNIANGATAALYNFTPFTSGNQSFDNIFVGWFGNIYGKISQYAGQSGNPSLRAGQVQASFMKFKNTGTVNWYDDTNATANNSKPIHLAVTNPINSKSSFGWDWPNLSRPALNFSAVYEADGTTLAADQHIATPGQIAKFSFNITVPYGYSPGTYRLYLQPIQEGAQRWDMGSGKAWFDVTVVPDVYKAQYLNQTYTPSLHAGQIANSYIRYKNAGNVNWYDDTNATANNSKPIHLAVTHPINSKSSFGWDWPNLSRPAVTLSAVYEADGTTLAGNQHIVQPGQIAKFSFNITIPYGYHTGKYRLYLQPILEGAAKWDVGGVAWFDVTVN